MRKVTIGLVVLGVLALAFISMPMRAQNQTYPFPGYPPEFSPLVTSRPAKPQRSLVPPTKFVKVRNAIPNRYIVVLNDDVVSSDAPQEARRAVITAIANAHAQAHLGKVGYIYETALKGYSIELGNEAAAIAISQNPQVKWVEEVGRLQLSQAQPEFSQNNPPWGLDAIDGSIPVSTVSSNGTTNGIYIYNALGSSVTAYVLDSGLRRTHHEFAYRTGDNADCIAYANCASGPPSPYLDSCIDPTKPNANDNDCRGHGTHVAGTLGGSTYGVAKNVTDRVG